MTAPLDRLPASARRKVTMLADLAAEAEALVQATGARIRDVELALTHAGVGKPTGDLHTEVSRLREIASVQAQRAADRRQLVAQLQSWLFGLRPRFVIGVAKPVQARRQPGESALDAVRRVRETITALQTELRNTQTAPPTRDEQHEHARAYVFDLQKRYKPRVKASRKFEFTVSDPASYTGRIDPLAVWAWVDPDRLVQRLCQEIDAQQPPGRLAMTATERDAKVQELRTALLNAAREEEQHIVEAALDGDQVIERRVQHADPIAILGVELKLVMPTDKPPPQRVERKRITNMVRGDAAAN